MWKSTDGRWISIALWDPERALSFRLRNAIRRMSDSSRAALAEEMWSGYEELLEILSKVDLPANEDYVNVELPPTVFLRLGAGEKQVSSDLLKQLIFAEDPRWWADLYDAVTMYLGS